MSEKRTMTLNLSDAEMRALEALCEQKDLSRTAVIRQALRLYQLVDARLARRLTSRRPTRLLNRPNERIVVAEILNGSPVMN
jgi:hypothetical protein